MDIDANLRGRLAFAKEPYLHPRRVPLTQAVIVRRGGATGMASTRTGSATSARDTVASRSRFDRSQKDPRLVFLFRSWYTLRYGSG